MRAWQAMMMAGGGAVDWWLSGGIAAANCIAAYQPKGAADLATSYINLANPGTYNAAPGVAPTWAAGTGWAFNGTTQYLTNGVVPSPAGSVLLRFANAAATTEFAFGLLESEDAPFGRYYLSPNWTTIAGVRYGNGTGLTVGPALTSGVIGMAGHTAYRNGASDGITADDGRAITKTVFIGAGNNYDTFVRYCPIDILALAIYDTTITAPQVAAVTTAMQAL
jgi:hypothetical protein